MEVKLRLAAWRVARFCHRDDKCTNGMVNFNLVFLETFLKKHTCKHTKKTVGNTLVTRTPGAICMTASALGMVTASARVQKAARASQPPSKAVPACTEAAIL